MVSKGIKISRFVQSNLGGIRDYLQTRVGPYINEVSSKFTFTFVPSSFMLKACKVLEMEECRHIAVYSISVHFEGRECLFNLNADFRVFH